MPFLFAALLMVSFLASADEAEYRSELTTLFLAKDLDLSPTTSVTAEFGEVTRSGRSDLVPVTLTHSRTGTIRLLLKGDAGFLTRKRVMSRSLLLVSGFFTGQESVRLIGDVPETVVVGFQYPYAGDDFLKKPELVGQFIRQTPGQIALALFWIARQPWADPRDVYAMGVSLGGFFLPVSLHLAQQMQVPVTGAIFVCSGAHITPVLESSLRGVIPDEAARPLVQLMANLTALHDPKLHLPMLRGRFLTVRADQDTTIPEASGVLLEQMLGGQKTSVLVHGPHINTDQTDVIRQTQEAVVRWLP